MRGHGIGRGGGGVPHHEAVGVHGIQVENRVQQSLALLQAGGLCLQVHGVRAEPRCRRPKADARARRSFEKRQRHRLSAQRRQFFQRMLLNFLKGLALIEKKSEFVRGERFEGQQIAEVVTQCPFSDVEPRQQTFQIYSTRSTSTTRSSLSIPRSRTSIISVSLVCTLRPMYCASIGISRCPRSISTQSDTRFGRPRSNSPFIAARMRHPVSRTASIKTS